MAGSIRAILIAFNRFAAYAVQPKSLAIWFLLCGLPTGLGCALLAPVGMFPDEFAHASRADALRYGEIYGVRPPAGIPAFSVNAGVMVNAGFYMVLTGPEFSHAFPDKPVRAQDRRAAEATPWLPGKLYFPSQMVEYFPIMYMPAALGLAAGGALGLTPLHAFYLGRIAMLLGYLALGAAAIGTARFGNALLFAVLTLPTAINLGSSYNQDGMIIACCALAVGLLSRCRLGGAAWHG